MRPRKQSGFVLVIGLMLLTVASGAVVSSMSLNKYQERQAGNYVRANNYGAGADEAFRRFERNEKSAGIDDDVGWKSEIEKKVNEVLEGGDLENNKIILSYKKYDGLLLLPDGKRRKIARERKEEKKEGHDDGGDVNYAFTQAGIREIVKLKGPLVRVDFWGKGELSGNDIEGNNGQATLHAYYSITKGEEDDGDQPGSAYREVLLGCEGVSLSGSAKIDSYDSRKGAYGAKLEDGGYNRNGTQGVVSTNADEDGNVTLNGSSPIYGQVRATGNVTASGSASIHGDIQANGDVIISGGGSKILGNVASRQAVRLSSSGLVEGNVKANTEIVTGNWSSRIEGDATAPVVRTTTNRDVAEQVEGTINLTSPNVGEVTTASCDSFTTREGATIGELSDALAPYASSGSLSIGGGNQTYTLTPSGLQVPADRNNNSVPNPDSYQVTRDVTVEGVFPEPTNALVLDSFSLGGSANFVVDGGDMTLYVKGDINIGGGASFTVAEGSSLKIVTDGRFNLPSGLDIASDSGTDDEGNPILSIYSTFDDGGASGWNAGVNISGNSTFRGTIFAPYSTVNVGGSGELFGAVKGQRVEVSGSGDIHYDEALMESSIGTGDGGSGNEAGDGEGGENNGDTTWTLVGLSYGQPEE